MRSNLPTFTSHTQRTRGGIGFYSDTRSNSRLEIMGCTVSKDPEILPGELRKYNKRTGQGQHFDFFEVKGRCARCHKEKALNVVSLCGQCNEERAKTGTAELAEEIAVQELTALIIALSK